MTGKKIHCLAVDDEPPALLLMEKYITAVPILHFAGKCSNAVDAMSILQQHPIDLIFLDIQMPHILGTDFIRALVNPPKVVFTTAFRKFAVEGFELDAVDYLLKPIGRDRFEAALGRASERLGGGSKTPAMPPGPELAAAARPPQQYLDRIPVRDGVRVFIIPVVKLDYAEAQDDYVELTAEGKKHLKQQTISSLESALDPARFLRIHRSYIVNLERVTRIEPYAKESHVAVLSNGATLPVSRAGYARLRAFLDR